MLTPYYTEEVLFSLQDLETQNEDGVSILFYLQKIFPGSLRNTCICRQLIFIEKFPNMMLFISVPVLKLFWDDADNAKQMSGITFWNV